MKEQKKGRGFSLLFYLLLLSSAILYIWIFSRTPYGLHDDILWGVDLGIRMFLTGSDNNRYIGNLLEIIVTRSGFLKAVLHGLIAAAIPFLIAVLVKTRTRSCMVLNEKADRLPETVLLFSNFLFLTIPLDVWQDTYGWIAGFSNYGLALLFFAVFQLLLSRIFLDDVHGFSAATGFGYFVFGICIQLVLENMTLYVFFVDFILLIIMMIEKRSKAARSLMLVMLVGNTIGLFIMFSNSLYGTLIHSGTALDGYRTLAFDLHDNLFNIFVSLNKRFVYFYPNCIFGNNWLICCLITVLLFLICGKGKRLVKFGIRIFALSFFVYFLLARFFGPLENYLSHWNVVHTQWLNLLFFWGVFLSILLLPWTDTHMRIILVFLWLSAPGIVAPLIAVKLTWPRYFLFSSFFLIEFCMFLLAEVYEDCGKQRRVAECFILFAYLLVAVHRFSVYYDIGQGLKEREALIRAAQNGETDWLCFEELPHSEYVAITEPKDDEYREVAAFKEFYKIPDSVKFYNSLEDVSPEE